MSFSGSPASRVVHSIHYSTVILLGLGVVVVVAIDNFALLDIRSDTAAALLSTWWNYIAGWINFGPPAVSIESSQYILY